MKIGIFMVGRIPTAEIMAQLQGLHKKDGNRVGVFVVRVLLRAVVRMCRRSSPPFQRGIEGDLGSWN
jgi:hypothetical protein